MNGDFALAVHALTFLNRHATTVSSEELAKNICTHPVRVRRIMSYLKNAKLVETKEGRRCGGYLFTMDADKVTLFSVAEAIGTKFVSSNWHSGSIDRPCVIASGMANVMDGIYSELNMLCYSKLKDITIADIDSRIFDNKQTSDSELLINK